MRVQELLEQELKAKRVKGKAQSHMREVLRANGATYVGQTYTDPRANNRRRAKTFFRFSDSEDRDELLKVYHGIVNQLSKMFKDRHAKVKIVPYRGNGGELHVTLDNERESSEAAQKRRQRESIVKEQRKYLHDLINDVSKPYGGKSNAGEWFSTRKSSKNRREYSVRFKIDTPTIVLSDLRDRFTKALSDLHGKITDIDHRWNFVSMRIIIDDRLP